jgi:hypothetical protein
MIRIIPAPVLGSTIVIEKYPLEAFEITIEHLV